MPPTNRTFYLRVALIGITLLMLWVMFGQGTTSRSPGQPEPVSYSEMLQFIEKRQVVSATYDTTTSALLANLTTDVKSASPPAATALPAKARADVAEPSPPSLPVRPEPSAASPALSRPVVRRVIATLPPSDTATLPRLAAQAKLTIAERRPPSMLSAWALALVPIFLLIGLMWWLMRRTASGTSHPATGFGKSRVQMLDPAANPTRFADVAGCDEAKAEVVELVDFLKQPEQYAKVGGKMPHGVLLAGPPGTGKTLLAKAIAGEAKVPFFFTSGSDFVEMFVGVGASRVRDTFAQAKAQAPSIIFIDELDAVGGRRSAGAGGGHEEREQTLNQLLVEMNGFKGNEGVIVLAATNRPDMLDEALKRPGRFDREVVVGLPDRAGRVQILQVHARKVSVDARVDWDVIARGTPGFSGADLANLVNEAALAAAREGKTLVTTAHLEWARDRVMMGAEKAGGLKNERERKITAYHEAGHALVAHLIEGADPVHKITIVPRGRALGLTMQLPKEDTYNLGRDEVLTRIAVLMGGRAAEDVALNQCTAGASNDFARAQALARRLVATWGMDKELGPVSFDGESGALPGYDNGWSERWKIKIDDRVAAILREQYARASTLLRTNLDSLERVSLALLEHETLGAEQFEALVTASVRPTE